MRAPRVSVIVPTHDRANLIGQAVRSVLAQTFADLELIVVDDGSRDRTTEVLASVEDGRLRVVRQEQRGVAAALNAGLAAARGEFVARCDSDDVWLPDLLAVLLPALETDPTIGLVYGRAGGMRADGSPSAATRGYPPRYPGDALRSLVLGDSTASITTIVRRSCLESAGGWDESLAPAEDWDMALRVARRHGVTFVDRVVARVREHAGNMTALGSPGLARRLAVRRRVLDKVFAAPDVPEAVLAMRPAAYRNLHTGEGLQWIAVGRYAEALRAFGRALRAGGNPLRTAGRIAWCACLWFGAGRRFWGPLAARGHRLWVRS